MASIDPILRNKKVTAVIPARNEAASIREVIEETLPYVAEVLVVDGHSADETAALARSAGARVILDRGRGKGDAIRCAIAEIRTEVTVFMDADGSHRASDIPRLVDPILRGEADHVGGSRLLGGSSELHGGFDEFFRLAGSSFITACINHRFGVRISDSQNGFRAIRTEVLRKLGLSEDITTIEQEMVIRTLNKGYRLSEVPAHEHARLHGRSSIVLRKVWFRYLWSTCKHLLQPREPA